MRRPTSFDEVKTIEDYLYFKYKNPSYGGARHEDYMEQRHDDDYDDMVLMNFKDSFTYKIYRLYVHDVKIFVVNRGKIDETFNIHVSVTNVNWYVNKNPKIKMVNHLIRGGCISPFAGAMPTEYALVQCKFHDADFSEFDNVELH